MSAQDYRINALVRRLLVRHWVDVTRLQIGTTNGIVYVIGVLDTVLEDPTRRLGERSGIQITQRTLKLINTLEKEIRRLPSVRDAVFKIEQVCKQGGRWRANSQTPVKSPIHHKQRPSVRRPFERQKTWSVDEEGES